MILSWIILVYVSVCVCVWGGSKSNYLHPYKREAEEDLVHIRRKEGKKCHMARDYSVATINQGTPVATRSCRGKKWILPESPGGHGHANTLILDF